MPRKDETKKKAPKPEDVVFVHARTDDGEGHVVVRKRGESITLGEVRPMREGKPITGEVVRLTPREGTPQLADVEVLHAVAEEESSPSRGGPAQVSTPAYRTGWNAVFGEKKSSQARLLN